MQTQKIPYFSEKIIQILQKRKDFYCFGQKLWFLSGGRPIGNFVPSGLVVKNKGEAYGQLKILPHMELGRQILEW